MSKPVVRVLCCVAAIIALTVVAVAVDRGTRARYLPHRRESARNVPSEITIPFEQLSKESQEVIARLIAEGIARAAEGEVEELGLKDELEKALLVELDSFSPLHGSKKPVKYCVYLIRPGRETAVASVVDVGEPQRCELKLIRISAQVERPIAIVERCHVLDGRPFVDVRVLHSANGRTWMEVAQEKKE